MSTSCDTSQSKHDTTKLIDTSRPVHLFDLIEDRQEGEGRHERKRKRKKKKKNIGKRKKKDNGREPGIRPGIKTEDEKRTRSEKRGWRREKKAGGKKERG